MPEKSHSTRIWLKRAVALALLALLAACGGISPPTASAPSSQGYLLTVPIAASDTPEGLAQRYGGEVIAWLEDKAILKLSSQAAAALQGSGVSLQNRTLEPNSTVRAPATALGFNSWAGGFNSWAGGFNSWAGGWNSWAGGTGTLPALPNENRYLFLLTKLPQAQALARGFGQGIKVAVLDTGIDLAHPQFLGRLAPVAEHYDFVGRDFVPQEQAGAMYGHGTGVASLILQVAPRATILPIRVLNGDGAGTVADVISGIQHAINMDAKIINLSLGSTENNAALKAIVDTATAQGRYVVASAGNTGDSNVTYPAAWAKTGSNQQFLLSVGSVSSALAMSLFSCSGTVLEFVAPGEGVAGAYPDLRYASYRGTSFATPQVSGALALAMTEISQGHWGTLESRLWNSGSSVSGYRFINLVGFLQQFPEVPRKQALLVVNNILLGAGDSALKARLESIGYDVTVRTDTLSSTLEAALYDVVVISGSASPASVGTKFRDVAKPVVVMHWDLFDEMRMTGGKAGDRNIQSGQTQVTLLGNTHPLTAGLPSSNMTIYSSSDSLNWGKVASGAVSVASLTSDPTRSVLFGYDIGALMQSGIAPARRVGFFPSSTGTSRLTNFGMYLLEAAITWAVSGN
ncbi:MAG: S8 family serine peptidase [Meiothermus sp.]|uniref:S8 family serine peptidase n=1 Tax=Meiothermus sp. TaxID=1955249 RepID=UPI0025FA5360|nr:S8 family serine peptidase [Meiothermus sp.]MCS7069123.1 S8 family serine peptidase [Meiothermus sp.]MDW8426828.1 S8 family serine peptidase [Meiothermus sp.]